MFVSYNILQVNICIDNHQKKGGDCWP